MAYILHLQHARATINLCELESMCNKMYKIYSNPIKFFLVMKIMARKALYLMDFLHMPYKATQNDFLFPVLGMTSILCMRADRPL